MQKHYLTVSKTARYFTKGILNESTQNIWVVIHGYAQTAEAFLNSFEGLGSEHFVIAPEGLNKFYSRGFAGSPVASWMTSLEREHEIADYTHYLNTLAQTLDLAAFTKAKLIVLGFSQGVSTQTRFINSTSLPIHLSVMVAGEIGKEFQKQLPAKLAELKSLYLVGTNENIIKPEKIVAHETLFKDANCIFSQFEGKHEVNGHTIDVILAYLKE